ncbi:MAG: hypothetical protein JSV88_00155 [Candidatus Aminicenantes bacterium]|nr:MAG: hypothetical protein JSV88_00155 [Candidatus Aminicenantes bacterium]
MKLLIKIIILGLVFYLCYCLVVQGQTVNISRAAGPNTTNVKDDDAKKETKTEETEKPPPNLDEYDGSEMEEEDIFSYDQDFLTRKIYQKKLQPLTNKERIIWSFRMAETNAFL